MKAFVIGIVVLVLVGVGGYFGLQYVGKSSGDSTTEESQAYKTESITREGVLQKSSVAGTDYNHVIVGSGKYYGVTSYSLQLDQYVGKKVQAVGQNSGDTLYADSVTVIE